MNRVHRVQNAATNDRVGCCLDVADLFMSKAAAGRDKDRVFCMALLQHGYVKPSQWVALLDVMSLDAEGQRRLRARIQRWSRALRDAGHDIAADGPPAATAERFVPPPSGRKRCDAFVP